MKTKGHTATIGGAEPATSYRRLSEDKEQAKLSQLPEYVLGRHNRRFHRDDLVIVEMPGEGFGVLAREVWAAGVRA